MQTQPQRLTPLTVFLLVVPPLLWAGNAVVGRLVRELVSPLTLNFVRWVIAFLIVLPLAAPVLRRGSPLWPHWRRYALLGLLGIGLYNAFQYLALQTSTPINVTLVGSSVPLWMLATGALFFGARISAREVGGALLSMAGVLLVLSRGEWRQLMALRLVPGDLYMILGSIAWACDRWMRARTHEPKDVRQDWSALLTAQLGVGIGWSGALAAGEWTLTDAHIDLGWPLLAAMLFIGIGPAVLAYRCWGTGVQRAGPQAASIFMNLTPLFAAVLSAAFLRELPHWYPGAAFVLIVGGIVVSSRR